MTGEKTHNSGTGHVTVGGQCSRKRQMGNEASCFLPLRGWSRTRKMQSRWALMIAPRTNGWAI